MKADHPKGPGFFLFESVALLLLAGVTFRDSLVTATLSHSEKAFLGPQSLKAVGIFHPLTEEYLRQRSKEVPYTFLEKFPEREEVKVFERLSPLELVWISEEPLSKKRKVRRIPLGEVDQQGEWKPLSPEERQKLEREWALKAVEMGAELADSLHMPRFSEGLLWTTQRFNAYRHHLAEQYRLHFNVSEEDATLTYNVKY